MGVNYDQLTAVISVMSDVVEAANMSIEEQIEFCDTLAKVFSITSVSLKDMLENGEFQEGKNASDAR